MDDNLPELVKFKLILTKGEQIQKYAVIFNF